MPACAAAQPAGAETSFAPTGALLQPGVAERTESATAGPKDKLGNEANASSEVEFEGATAWLVGEEGRGVPQTPEIGAVTRLDCALGTGGPMRQALSLALNHTAQRAAFGKPLIEQPLMTNVLADLALESEAATALALRLARTLDHPHDAHEVLMRRLLTPVAKCWLASITHRLVDFRAMRCCHAIHEGLATRALQGGPRRRVHRGGRHPGVG